ARQCSCSGWRSGSFPRKRNFDGGSQMPALPGRWTSVLMGLLLAAGLYLPTSLAQTISVRLYLLSAVLLLSILVALLLRKRGVLSVLSVVNVVAINVILLLCTLLSPLTQFAYGGYIPILLFSVLFCVNVR